jgi:2-hydroxy-3-keto-5-methylthiopentenyl-1-phosphate phosphatase
LGEVKKLFDKKENKPVLAICYDFDRTLSPNDMQAQGYIQAVYDGNVQAFWDECENFAKKNEMDSNLAYMHKMVEYARGRILLTRKTLRDYGAKVELFPGVAEWFERIRRFGEENNVIVEHYIISSGLKEMIEGTTIAREFKKIYASSFAFDDTDVPIWPAQGINYTNKTQFLFRIEKDVLDVNDTDVNKRFSPEKIRVPFRNIVYIGDSATDIPCMKLVNVNGGHSIAVYNSETLDKTRVFQLLTDNRIKYFAPADYREDSDLDKLLKAIIVRTAANEALEEMHFACKKERDDAKRLEDDEHSQHLSLIVALDGSHNFERTHALMPQMLAVDDWTEEEIELLLGIALNRHPVRYLLNDDDVNAFYRKIIGMLRVPTEKAQKVMYRFNKE